MDSPGVAVVHVRQSSDSHITTGGQRPVLRSVQSTLRLTTGRYKLNRPGRPEMIYIYVYIYMYIYIYIHIYIYYTRIEGRHT